MELEKAVDLCLFRVFRDAFDIAPGVLGVGV